MSQSITISRRCRPKCDFCLEALEERTLLSTLTVMNNADSGSGSLRDAITSASAGDVITFDPGLRGRKIELSGPFHN